jgi:uncharacterized protein YcfL
MKIQYLLFILIVIASCTDKETITQNQAEQIIDEYLSNLSTLKVEKIEIVNQDGKSTVILDGNSQSMIRLYDSQGKKMMTLGENNGGYMKIYNDKENRVLYAGQAGKNGFGGLINLYSKKGKHRVFIGEYGNTKTGGIVTFNARNQYYTSLNK